MSSATTITAIAAVASTAVGVASAQQQAQAAKNQAKFQQQVAANNAIIAQQNATRIRQQAEVAEEEQRERLRLTKGAATARLAASGLLVDDDVDATSALFLQDIAESGEYDILKLRDNYEQEARAAEIQGSNFQAQSSLFGLQASNQSPGFAAAGALLSGAGKVASAGKTAGWWGGGKGGGTGWGDYTPDQFSINMTNANFQ